MVSRCMQGQQLREQLQSTKISKVFGKYMELNAGMLGNDGGPHVHGSCELGDDR